MTADEALTVIAGLFAAWLAWPCLVLGLFIIGAGLYIGGGVAWYTVSAAWSRARRWVTGR